MKGLSWNIGTGPQVCLFLLTSPRRYVSVLSLMNPPMSEEKNLAVNLLLYLWNDVGLELTNGFGQSLLESLFRSGQSKSAK